ncbi:MAG: T9SS type A sorting domain-containing protein [Dysgonamonadaceae bacterium]|nr:T9SS type A sorting domain-containing protein [Dysgonamonadaceae bacterium]
MQIYDLLGKLVATLPLDPNTGQIVLPETPQGIYIYTLTENGKTIQSNKYIVR